MEEQKNRSVTHRSRTHRTDGPAVSSKESANKNQDKEDQSQEKGSVQQRPAKRGRAPRYKDRRDFPRSRRLIPIVRPDKEKGEEAGKDSLKIIPLGGLGEVGRNMTVIEYKEDIMIIDVGFGFAEDDMPGIDYTLPNISYLDGKQDRIKGIVITHGHMDHVGGIPYLIKRLGNPTIYTASLTRGIIIKRHMEFPELPELDIEIVQPGETITLGQISVELFHVNHNIPDDIGLIIDTPAGRIVHTADFKFDPKPLNEAPADLDFIKSIGDRGVTLLMSDSTGAEKDGTAVSESVIQENLEVIFKEATGMLITGTFSSIVNRIQQLITLSEKYGRKVVFDGFSLKSNVEVAKELGQIKMAKGTQISAEQISDYPRSKVTLIGTGAQGEGRAVLMRIASGEHRHVQLQKNDSVIFSSSVIPGNERTVQRLKDLFYRLGARVYHYGMMDIHASGHAHRDDLRKMLQLIRPKFLMPIHGQYSMMINHGYLGQAEGIPEDNVIIADNGSIVNITPEEWWVDKKSAPSDIIMVDGLGIGDIGNVVLRDRQVLAEDGMFVIIALIDSKTGKVRGSPDIISRGFIYLKENKDLLAQVRKKIRFIIERKVTRPINWVYIKDALRHEVGLFLFQKTERRP
ncbi:MAG: RNase J family beta-CASP ribonuclease, partial [Candidatus Paceibacterota bacterium]